MKAIRQPIVSVLGHVDHGKTTLLDRIRGTTVAQREAGLITQHIGATEIPMDVIKKVCGSLLERMKIKITIPGLLIIDTPGHEAFTTLRKRGGALADIAVLVVDINEGFQPQTIESLTILRTYKTPFILALNKIDRIMGWKSREGEAFTAAFAAQSEEVKKSLESRLYEIVGTLHEQGFESERFDRVERFEKQVTIVPVSGKTGEGIPELLMFLTGLAQRFLESKLEITIEAPGRGTVLEVKEERGLGTTVDVILYEGKVKKGDSIAVGGKEGTIMTTVRAILKPRPLDEIRDPKFRFNHIPEVYAASGIKVAAPKLDRALAGSQLSVVLGGEEERIKEEMAKELESVVIRTEELGVVVKTDTIGALEALVTMLKDASIPIRLADVGDVSKRDVVEAAAVKEKDKTKAVVLAFNVSILPDALVRASDLGVRIIESSVIYKIVEDYEDWVKELKEQEKKEEFDALIRPVKIKIIPGTVFRQNKPAIVGVEVLEGIIKPRYELLNKAGAVVGVVKGLQDKGENLPFAEKGKEVAVSIDGPTIGRQVNEGEILYGDVPEAHAKLLMQKYRNELSPGEVDVLEEVKDIKRRTNPLWGM
ncbi:MAG: translation initiation factor IF-2 [Candidatus Hydrothermarchaeales archaeon]